MCECAFEFEHFILGINKKYIPYKKNVGNTIIESEEKEERKRESGVSFFMKFDNDAPNEKSEWKKKTDNGSHI